MGKSKSVPDFTKKRLGQMDWREILDDEKEDKNEFDIIIEDSEEDLSIDKDGLYQRDELSNAIFDLKEHMIMAGTIKELTMALVYSEVYDPEYLDLFLTSHSTFVDSWELLSILLDYYYNPPCVSDQENILKIRVVNVIKKWLLLEFNIICFSYLVMLKCLQKF